MKIHGFQCLELNTTTPYTVFVVAYIFRHDFFGSEQDMNWTTTLSPGKRHQNWGVGIDLTSHIYDSHPGVYHTA